MTAKEVYTQNTATVEELLLKLSHTAGTIEAFRQGQDSWSDCAEMARYIEPLEQILHTMTLYAKRRGVEV